MSFTLLGILNSQAAGGGGEAAFDLLETTILSSTATDVSFTGLDSYTDYKHLQVRVVAGVANITSNNVTHLDLRFNSDTSNNYKMHAIQGAGSSIFSDAAINETYIRHYDCLPYLNSGLFGGAIIDILDFSSTDKYTTTRAIRGGIGPTENEVGLVSGLWVNTAAVTDITLKTYNASYPFKSQSRFSLYGVK